MAATSVEDILDLVEILRTGLRATTAQSTLSLYDTQLIKKTYPPRREAPDSVTIDPGVSATPKTKNGTLRFSLPFSIYLSDGFLLAGFVRKHGSRGFTRQDRQMLSGLTSPLIDVAKVLLRGSLIGDKEALSNAFDDDLGRESFVVDRSLRVVFRSSHIESLLNEQPQAGVVLNGRFDFPYSTFSVPKSFYSLIYRYIHSDLAKASFSFFSGDGRPMTAFARRITLPDEPLETYYAFAIQRSVVDFKVMAADLGSRFGFTSRQSEIVEHILKGMPYSEICETLCISRDTLKSHSRQIFRKAAVRNRAELFAAAIGSLDTGKNNPYVAGSAGEVFRSG
jgi:DNA-binding CsgD family transcriptional regulator